jgi:hypothetical protein
MQKTYAAFEKIIHINQTGENKMTDEEMEEWVMREYCKRCGNHIENCTCEQCAKCKDFFPLHELYNFNTLAVCKKCLSILEQRTTANI